VVNRKGGSGKTTLATHLAVYCAGTGVPVMLADVDRQQSTQAWLRRRDAQRLPSGVAIKGRVLPPNTVVRPPKEFVHVILDTPGGLRGFDLTRVVMYADAILMPVGASVFDRESTADCFAEIKALPRVASGRCKVAAVGVRLDPRTNGDEVLRTWAQALQLSMIGFLRDSQTYVRCADRGLTLFDLPAAKAQSYLHQWQSIIDWLDPLFELDSGAIALGRPTSPMTLPRANGNSEHQRASSLSVQASGERRVLPSRGPNQSFADRTVARATIATRIGKLMDSLAVPRFLQRGP
jgi:chromosome partitioning protein